MPDHMNPAQREAALYDGTGPVLVLAGPGSGKTYVITQRVQYLTEVKKVSPDKILVLTFARDAANSMKERYLNAITAVKHKEVSQGVKQNNVSQSVKRENVSQHVKQNNVSQTVNFGTFHSIFYQILKQSTNLRDKQILTDLEKKQILTPIFEKTLTDLGYLEKKNLWIELVPAISFYKNTGQMERACIRLNKEVKDKFPELVRQYETERKLLGKLDFDDMLTDCHALLKENADLRRYWQDRFEHILIDEFQDINHAQYQVIKLLSKEPRNIFAVGDDDQAIYGFRGSDPACMSLYAKEFNPKIVRLEENYRSMPEIVNASAKMIKNNRNRFEKKPKSSMDNGSKSIWPIKRERTVEKKGFSEKDEEMNYVLKSCREFLEMGERETMAILFRTNRELQKYAMLFKKNKVPFVSKEATKSPYQNECVRDVLDYLRYAIDKDDAEALLRIINKPSRYVKREVVAACMDSGGNGDDLLSRIKEHYAKIDARIAGKCEILGMQKDKIKELSPFTAVQYILKMIGYEKWIKEELRNSPERLEEMLDSLRWLSEEAKAWEDIREWIMALEDEKLGRSTACHENKQIKPENQVGQNTKIVFMTVHAAKGLEFDRVVLPDVIENNFPHGTMLDDATLEEERRVFYVGMTRAKSKLLLTYVNGGRFNARPSRFLKEI